MPELWELSAEEIAARVRGRETSAAEVLESCLERTARVEPLIGAYLEVFENEARARAAEIDRRLAAGEDPGPLAGVPVALKDNLSLEGRALTCGSRILAGYVAPYTATAVERLLAAGAVPVGRANMDEFAMGSSCENSAYQLTRNPWDLAAVPGGSSGGPAAAVAAGSVPLSFGSDTGGSVRQPAALCGVVGVKPTYGRVSRYGLVAFASSTDQIGPIARNVRDAALALQVIAGADPCDPTSAAEPVGDYLERIEDGIAGRRIGILRETDPDRLGGDVARNWRQSLDRLARAGAELVEVSVPSIDGRDRRLLRDRHLGGERQPRPLRRRALRLPGAGGGRPGGSLLREPQRGVRRRGQAAHHARHLRPLLRLLRRLLRPRPRRARADAARARRGARARPICW